MVMNKPATPLSPLSLAFAAQVKAERAAMDLTQTELAKAAGMGRTTLIRIEAGTRDMDTSQMYGLCKAFGLSAVEFAMRAERRLSQAEALTDEAVEGSEAGA